MSTIFSEEQHKRITLLLENVTMNDRLFIKSIKKSRGLMEELTSTELCPSSAPKSVQPLNQSAAVLHPSPGPMDIKKIMVYPPPPFIGGISINTEDYGRLKSEKFLNDIIIDFYLKYLWLNEFSEEQKKKVFIFSSYFYTKLMKKTTKTDKNSQSEDSNLTPAAKRHSVVKSWTKNTDLFKYEYIIIPVNEDHHWFLAVICFPELDGPVRMIDNSPVPNISRMKGGRSVAAGGLEQEEARVSTNKKSKEEDLLYKAIPCHSKVKRNLGAIKQPCILLFDSLTNPDRRKVITILRQYLQEEWKVKHKDKPKDFSKKVFKGSMPIVPQQPNLVDCGVYLLQFVDSFFKNPITDYRLPIRSISEWFTKDMVGSKRHHIMTLLHNIMRDQNIDTSTLNLPKLDLTPPKVDKVDEDYEENEVESMNLSEVKEEGITPPKVDKVDEDYEENEVESMNLSEVKEEGMDSSLGKVSSGQGFDSPLPRLQPSSDPPPPLRLREPKDIKSKLKLLFSLNNMNTHLSSTDTTEEKDDKKSQMD